MKSKDTCFSLEGKLGVSSAYYRSGDYSKSEEIAKEILQTLNTQRTSCSNKLLSNTLGRLFWISKNQNRYEEALEYLLEQEKLLNQIPVSDTYQYHYKYARFYTFMGLIEMELGYFDNAKQKIQQAFQEFEKIESDNRFYNYNKLIIEASANNILGEAYLNISQDYNDKRLDSAAYYFTQARNISNQFDPVHEGSENIYQMRLASVLIKKEEYERALEKIDSFSFNNERYKTTQDINHLKSLAFYNQQKMDSSFRYADRFLCFSKQTPSAAKNKIIVLNIVAEYYKSLKKIDSAYKYSELARKELDTFSKNLSSATYSHYLYDFNKVRSLNNQLLNDSSKANKTNNLLWYLLLASIIIAFISWYYMKNKRRELEVKFQESFTGGSAIIDTKPKEYIIKKSLEDEILDFLKVFEDNKEYLDHSINIQELANKADTNTSYLSSVINKNKGKSFKLYMSELRINYLIEVLKSDIKLRSYTVQALAEEVGYTNASAFTRAFKKQTGVTPSQFLKSLKD